MMLNSSARWRLVLAIALCGAAAEGMAAPTRHTPAPAPVAQARLADGEACVPAWPDSALARGKSGTTSLRLRIGADGAVVSAAVTSSSGFPDLDQATIAAASKCRFVPRQLTGTRLTSPVVFTHVWARESSPAAAVGSGSRPAARKPCARMAYPAASLASGEQGTVHMSFLIDADGAVLEKNVVRSSGFPELDRATLEGMSKCEFSPAITNGKPEKSLLSFSYTWTLN